MGIGSPSGSRWSRLVLVGAIVLTAGCLIGNPPDSLPSTEEACLTDDVPRYDGPIISAENASYPSPPSQVTEQTAGEFAAEFHETSELNALALQHEEYNDTILSHDISSEVTSTSQRSGGYEVTLETHVSYQSSAGIASGFETHTYFLNESVVYRTRDGPNGRTKTVLVRCPGSSE